MIESAASINCLTGNLCILNSKFNARKSHKESLWCKKKLGWSSQNFDEKSCKK